MKKRIRSFVFVMLIAFGIQQSFAQSSIFQRDENVLNYDNKEGVDRHGGSSGSGEGVEIPIGGGLAVLIGCATLYACARYKKENE